MIIVFEGWDAADKGGDIHRLVKELNPRFYRAVSVGPPKVLKRHINTFGAFVKWSLKRET
jgi:AMP-polyphosphate phosphotransferase